MSALETYAAKNSLERFKDLYAGINPRAYIVGKGPSLDTFEKVIDEINGPIFCLNESIKKVEQLSHTYALFCVQQDCNENMGSKCVPREAVHFMNCWQTFTSHPFTGELKARREMFEKSKWNQNAVLCNPADFGEFDCELSAVMALHLAKHMGCKAVTFCCFDSWAAGGSCEYAKAVEELGGKSGDYGDPGRHRTHMGHILSKALALGFEVDTLHPKVSIQ